MSWARRRRALYLTIIFGILAVIVAVPVFMWLYEPATCFDGIQNQTETAVDRGGPCALLDERALIPHAVLWARSFEVRDGVYSAVAYIENPNQSAAVLRAPYRFKLYDANNIIVAEQEGVTFLMPGTITPVFAGPISTGQREVARTFFEFVGPLVWERAVDASQIISVTNKRISGETTRPRISAVVTNTSIYDVSDVRVIAVAFDAAGNAINASETVVPFVSADASEPVVFTWPEGFTRPVARIDVRVVMEPVQ